MTNPLIALTYNRWTPPVLGESALPHAVGVEEVYPEFAIIYGNVQGVYRGAQTSLLTLKMGQYVLRRKVNGGMPFTYCCRFKRLEPEYSEVEVRVEGVSEVIIRNRAMYALTFDELGTLRSLKLDILARGRTQLIAVECSESGWHVPGSDRPFTDVDIWFEEPTESEEEEE
jgi:hypothetical protein